ncbi:MAG: hypothetical protein Q7J27_13325 [Syntrophales bacterium]|nr:hypothetical protein [Syntrophales bacterium]
MNKLKRKLLKKDYVRLVEIFNELGIEKRRLGNKGEDTSKIENDLEDAYSKLIKIKRKLDPSARIRQNYFKISNQLKAVYF